MNIIPNLIQKDEFKISNSSRIVYYEKISDNTGFFFIKKNQLELAFKKKYPIFKKIEENFSENSYIILRCYNSNKLEIEMTIYSFIDFKNIFKKIFLKNFNITDVELFLYKINNTYINEY